MPKPRSTNTPAFKAWFGRSVVTDGHRVGDDPKRVYHGTTHSFEAFELERTNIENFMGRGFYFTDDPDDAAGNYGKSGKDLTNRIEHLADQLANSEDIDYEQAMKLARERLMGKKSQVLEVYLRIEKPFWYDKHVFEFSSEIPEDDLEEYREEATERVLEDYADDDDPPDPADYEDEIMDRMRDMWNDNGYEYPLTGEGYEFLKLVERHARDYYNEGSEDLMSLFGEEFGFPGEVDHILASNLMEFIKEKALPYLYHETDEGSEIATSEVLRMAIRDLGYDGVIMFPEQHFQTMNHVYGTTHYIVFNPKQVKSIYSGWNPDSEKFVESRFEGLMDEFELLVENSRDILYHDTSIKALDRILQLDQFELSNSHTKEVEEIPQSKGRPFFMSFSRNRANRFRESGGEVTLVVDGSGLRQHHRFVPLDYWQHVGVQQREQEERLLSRQPVVRGVRKFIREIHVLYNEKSTHRKWLEEMFSNIETYTRDIPVFYYSNRRDLFLMDKRKAIKPNINPDVYGERLYQERSVNEMLDFVQFLETGKTQDRKLRERLRRFWLPDDFVMVMSTDFHNFNTVKGVGAQEVHRRLTALMRQEGLHNFRELLLRKFDQYLAPKKKRK